MTAINPVLPAGPEDWYVTVHYYPQDAGATFSLASIRPAAQQLLFTALVERTYSTTKRAHVGCIEVYQRLPVLTTKEWTLLSRVVHDRLEAMIGKPVNAVDRSMFSEVLQ